MKRIKTYEAESCRMIEDEIRCALVYMLDRRMKKIGFTANGTTVILNENDSLSRARYKFDKARGEYN